jgi:spore coat protein U-like protein
MTITKRLLGFILVAAGLLASVPSYAVVSCNISVTPIVLNYDPTVTTEQITTGNVTIFCTRTITDANTFAYTAPVNNGVNNSGAQNRVKLGTNFYNYELYRLSPYINSNRWQTNPTTSRFSGTINFGAGLTGNSSHSFDLRVPGSQTVVPAGVYTDTVTAEVRNSAGTTLNSTIFGVSISTVNSCQLSSSPGNINFTYTSFQSTPTSTNTTFSARCTSGLFYSASLDATTGTLLGLNYTLSLTPASRTGSGVAQSFTINGSIAAGQAGMCNTASCNASQARTLTITY